MRLLFRTKQSLSPSDPSADFGTSSVDITDNNVGMNRWYKYEFSLYYHLLPWLLTFDLEYTT